jgi:hypothetical protein
MPSSPKSAVALRRYGMGKRRMPTARTKSKTAHHPAKVLDTTLSVMVSFACLLATCFKPLGLPSPRHPAAPRSHPRLATKKGTPMGYMAASSERWRLGWGSAAAAIQECISGEHGRLVGLRISSSPERRPRLWDRRDKYADGGSIAGRTLYFERPAQAFGALAHGFQAEAPRERAGGVEARAVVGDFERYGRPVV